MTAENVAQRGRLMDMTSDDDLHRFLEGDDPNDPLAGFRRAADDAHAVFEALAFQDFLSSLRNAVLALDESSAKRALIAAAIGRHSGAVSAEEHLAWMRAGGRLRLDFFDLD